MAYEISLHRSASRSIRRTLRKTLDEIGRVLAGADPDVHEARTSLKRARALLRLVRHDVGSSIFAQENGALREAGRALSALRDAAVQVHALDGLLERGSEEDRAALAPLRSGLLARRDRRLERSFEQVAEAARAVACARDRAGAVRPAHRGWKALARGLDRAYRDAHERAARAFATGRDEDLHALRKAVKDLTYQASFLRPIDEPAQRAERDRLQQLGDLLGDDHDLAVLCAIEGADPAALARLGAIAAGRRAELQREARFLAESLLAEPPQERLARLEAAFRAARDPAKRCPTRAPVPHFA